MLPPHITSRLYYDDPWRSECTATVTEIRELSRVDGKPLFQIALDRTCFYPSGGGQPHDTGSLVATSRNGVMLEALVSDVNEESSTEIWHTTTKPLQPGTAVVARIDKARRRDHMQQHTGQHLLSAVAARELNARTVGFHLGQTSSTIDLVLPSLDHDHVAFLQEQVNEAVMQAHPVVQCWLQRDEAEALLNAGILAKLPSRTGDLRIVSIGDIDRNACSGMHVTNTAQIGPVLLRRVEHVRGNVRLAFVCGNRALKAASADWDILISVATRLSTSPALLMDRIAAMQSAAKAASKLMRHA